MVLYLASCRSFPGRVCDGHEQMENPLKKTIPEAHNPPVLWSLKNNAVCERYSLCTLCENVYYFIVVLEPPILIPFQQRYNIQYIFTMCVHVLLHVKEYK